MLFKKKTNLKQKYLLTTALIFLLALVVVGVVGCTTPTTQLSTPQNLRVEGRVLYWDKVENADGYAVSVQTNEYETEEYKTTDNFFDVAYLGFFDTHKIEISAISNSNNYTTSKWATYSYTPETPVATGYDEHGFFYKLVVGANGAYEVSQGNANLKGHVVIPDYFKGLPVIKIADYGFCSSEPGKNWMTETLCNTVTTSIQLPKHLTSIGDHALAYMVRLKEVVIPDSVETIESDAFKCNTRMTKIVLPKNLKNIPNFCFMNTQLDEIILPSGLETIGEYAFCCEYDEYLLFGDKEPTEFHVESKLSALKIPDTVTSIGQKAFNGRENLKTVEMSKNIQDLGNEIFLNTSWYNTQPNGAICFEDILYCYKGECPQEYTIPMGIKTISEFAFTNQKKLVSVFIPDGVKLNGEQIFCYCTSLQYVRLPQDLTVLPDYTFYNTPSLRHIDLPDSLIKIGKSAFCQSGIEQLTIPNNVKSILPAAFNSCSRLLSLTIGKSVETIARANECYNLREIYNLSSLTITAGSNDCGGIALYAKDVYTSLESTSKIETDQNGFVFYNDNGEYELLSYDRTKKDIVLPDSYNGKTYAINYAFYYDKNIERLVVPESITNLIARAFQGCENLKEILLPNSITEIKPSTFSSCYSLTKVTLSNKLISIGDYAFSSCKSLETITYEGSQALEKVSFPDSLKTIGNLSFSGCEKLSTVNLGNGLESIGNSAFEECLNIEYFVIPKTVKSIGTACFTTKFGPLWDPVFYYCGTQEDFDQITIAAVTKTAIIDYVYFYYATEPALNTEGTAYDGNYWHYDTDNKMPVVWVKES